MSNRIITASATLAGAGNALLFPNGARNSNGGSDFDVWLGACTLRSLRILASVAGIYTVDIFNGLSSNNQVVRGGSPAVGDAHRITATTVGVLTGGHGLTDPSGCAVTASLTPGAQLTGLNKAMGTILAQLANGIQWERPLEVQIPAGCAVRVQIPAAATVAVDVEFTPWGNSGARRARYKLLQRVESVVS